MTASDNGFSFDLIKKIFRDRLLLATPYDAKCVKKAFAYEFIKSPNNLLATTIYKTTVFVYSLGGTHKHAVKNLMRVGSTYTTTPPIPDRPSATDDIRDTYFQFVSTKVPHDTTRSSSVSTLDDYPLNLCKPTLVTKKRKTLPDSREHSNKKREMFVERAQGASVTGLLQSRLCIPSSTNRPEVLYNINIHFQRYNDDLLHFQLIPLNQLLSEPFVEVKPFVAFYTSKDFLYLYTEIRPNTDVHPQVGFIVNTTNSLACVIDNKTFRPEPLFLPNSHEQRSLDIWPDTEFALVIGNSTFLNRLAALVTWVLRFQSSKQTDQYWCLDLFVDGVPVLPVINHEQPHFGLDKFEKSGYDKARLTSVCLRFSNQHAGATLRHYIKRGLSDQVFRCHFVRTNYHVKLHLSPFKCYSLMLALFKMPTHNISTMFDREITNGLPVVNVLVTEHQSVRAVIGCIKDYRYSPGSGENEDLIINLVASRANSNDLCMFYDAIAELCTSDVLYDFL